MITVTKILTEKRQLVKSISLKEGENLMKRGSNFVTHEKVKQFTTC